MSVLRESPIRGFRAALIAGILALGLAAVPTASAAGNGASTNGTVRAIVPDGSGGSYIAGDFTEVNGVTRNRIAHVLADGSVDNFNPNVNGRINYLSVAVVGSDYVFVIGGEFTSVNGSTTRNRLAAINPANGNVTSWNPNVNSTGAVVRSGAISGSTLYFGGSFSTVNGTSRNNAAAVDLSTGNVTSWNPNPNGEVRSVSVGGSPALIYLGGAFTQAGSTTRNRAAAFSVGTTATLQSWNPNPNGAVNAVVHSGAVTLLGGEFTSVNSATRNYAASVGSTGVGANSGLNPNFNGAVDTILSTSALVYFGGAFTQAGSTTRNRAAAFNWSDQTLNGWNPNLNGNLKAIAQSSTGTPSGVLIGGEFTTLNGKAQDYFSGPSVKPVSLDTGSNAVNKGSTIKSTGGFAGSVSPAPTYRWQRCTTAGDESSCSDMTDGTSANWGGAWYGTRDADIGYQVRLRTAFTDAANATTTLFSALSGLVRPVGTVAPTLSSASPKVGTNITSTFGTWNGFITGVSTVTFQWQACASNDPGTCADISGATGQSYKPVAGNVTKGLRVVATISTRGQTATQSSAISNAVTS